MKTSTPQSKDTLLQQVPQALARASEKARQLAEQTGTPYIVSQPSNQIPLTNHRK